MTEGGIWPFIKFRIKFDQLSAQVAVKWLAGL
jgi:hypothetical protein